MPKIGRFIILVIAVIALAGAKSPSAQAQVESVSPYPNAIETFDELKLSSLPVNPPSDINTCSGDQTLSCSAVCASPVVQKPTQANTNVLVAKEAPVEAVEITQATVTPTPINSGPTPDTNEPAYAPDNAQLNSDKIFDLINQYRTSNGLAAFEKENSVCELAQTRSSEIIAEVQNGSLHSGLYNRPLSYWIWENAKYGSNEEGTVAWWLSSAVHYQSIVGDYKYSCVKCTGSYCTQLFTSFAPK